MFWKSIRRLLGLKGSKYSLSQFLVIGLVLILVISVRIRLRTMPLERDEGEYAYAGLMILKGVPPYQEVYNMKLPGTYLAYAGIMYVLGQSSSGIHLGLMLVNLVSIGLVFWISRLLWDSLAGVVSAVIFALLSLSSSVLGLHAHATHFIVLFALLGMGLLLHGCTSCRAAKTTRFQVFGAGVCFGLAFLMKQHGIFFAAFGGLYLCALYFLPHRGFRGGQAGSQAVFELSFFPLYCGGFCLPYALTCLWLWACGVFEHFYFWTFSYARAYGWAISLEEGEQMLRLMTQVVLGPGILLWALGGVGWLLLWIEGKRHSVQSTRSLGAAEQGGQRERPHWPQHARLVLSLFLVCSVGSVSMGMYFRQHYFVTLLPAVAFLGGVAVSRSLWFLRWNRSLELLLAVPVLLLFFLGVGQTVVSNGAVWFGANPTEAMQEEYGTSLFCDAVKVAQTIRAEARPGTQIAVLGSEPEIPFYAQCRSATSYIYMYPLMEVQPYAAKMQDEFVKQVETVRPDYVVMVRDPYSWLARTDSCQTLERWWNDQFQTNYQLSATLPIKSHRSKEIEIKEGEEDVGVQQLFMIFKRKGL